MRRVKVELTERELAEVLASLRYRQSDFSRGADMIATDGGRLKEMTAEEVDDLCERLNFGATTEASQEKLLELLGQARSLIIDINNGWPLYELCRDIHGWVADAEAILRAYDVDLNDDD